MSGEHALRDRAELLDELHDIVAAMKNLAFAELQRVERVRPALAEALDALRQAMARLPGPQEAPGAGPAEAAGDGGGGRDARAWLVIGAERGFCGPFNAHLAAEMARIGAASPGTTWLVASRRLLDLDGAGTADTVGLPGCSTVEDSDDALEAWLEAIAPFMAGPRGEVWLLHTTADGLRRTRLRGADDGGVARRQDGPPGGREPPLHHLPWTVLQDALARQALRLRLQDALHESLSQENRWRLSQMQLAQDHLDELGRALRRRRSALRQAEITNELETLVSALPARPVPRPATPA